MASSYQDEERELRYIGLRKKKRVCEKIYDILAWVLGGSTLIFAGGAGWAGDLTGIIIMLIEAAAVIIVIYLKNTMLAAVGLGVSVLLLIFGLLPNPMLLFILLAVLVMDIAWSKLAQEEGFPDFKISLAEGKERLKRADKYIHQRALEEGVRVEADETTSQMGDLLDAEQDVQALPAELKHYHERSYNGDAAVKPSEAHDGVMSDLNEL